MHSYEDLGKELNAALAAHDITITQLNIDRIAADDEDVVCSAFVGASKAEWKAAVDACRVTSTRWQVSMVAMAVAYQRVYAAKEALLVALDNCPNIGISSLEQSNAVNESYCSYDKISA